jgi:protein-S-isoprenylcysteine O-methyltransferase Ste14
MKIPKWAIPIMWGIIVLVIMGILPWAVSLLGPRYGWDQGAPAAWNFIGLAGVVMGLVVYVWCLVFHYRTYRAPVNVGFDPPHLVDGGPYRFSRNPMYVAGLFTWIGWVVFYGSPAVFIGLVFLWVTFTLRVIPYEERQLEELFGGDYLEYKKSVRRWFGRM